MKELVDQLKRNRTLSPEELRLLLTDASPEEREYLHRAAREVARVHFGNGVFVRGLIEISNYCRNDCRYCGIRRSNRLAERYRLTPETVLACCEEGYRLGFRTFVLQSGEDPALNDELLTGLIRVTSALQLLQTSFSGRDSSSFACACATRSACVPRCLACPMLTPSFFRRHRG